MTRNRIRSIGLAILLAVGVLSSPVEAARTFFSESLPPFLYLSLADTAREGEPLLRVPVEIPGVSRRATLIAAFEILGWGHEMRVVENLCPEGFLACLSRLVDPLPPPAFLDSPDSPLQGDDVPALLNWIRSCRLSMSWNLSLAGRSTTLRLHREGTTSFDQSWEVRIAGELDENIARERLQELHESGFMVGLRKTAMGRFDLVAGPFTNFIMARGSFAALPPVPGMLIVTAPCLPGQPPLYWAAIQVRDPGSLPEIRFASELGSKRIELSSIAAAFGAEGGINGGFFSGAVPIGTLVVDGKLLSHSYGERSALGLNRGLPPVFGNGGLSLSIESATLRIPLDRLNELPRKDEIALFLHDERFPVPPGTVSGDFFIMPVTAEVSGSFSLPPAEATLLARGKGGESLLGLRQGEAVKVHAKWVDPRFEGREIVLQAGPGILENGVVSTAAESFDEKTRLQKHPRTLVGWDGNSLWWVVVDGRDPAHSVGLTIPESAVFALTLGLKDALNLDGGGSSTLWWKGGVVNLPPGEKERPLPYAILFDTASGSSTR